MRVCRGNFGERCKQRADLCAVLVERQPQPLTPDILCQRVRGDRGAGTIAQQRGIVDPVMPKPAIFDRSAVALRPVARRPDPDQRADRRDRFGTDHRRHLRSPRRNFGGQFADQSLRSLAAYNFQDRTLRPRADPLGDRARRVAGVAERGAITRARNLELADRGNRIERRGQLARGARIAQRSGQRIARQVHRAAFAVSVLAHPLGHLADADDDRGIVSHAHAIQTHSACPSSIVSVDPVT